MADSKITEIENLPVQLAIRLVLDDISYSNPLPSWFDAITIDYSLRELAIHQKLREFANRPVASKPFSILVPKKSGQKRSWPVPSVNEQIMLQACVSSFAGKSDADVLDARVFSYRYNRQEDLLGLVEDQLTAWTRFQDETKRRCEDSQCILQIDLQNAFQSRFTTQPVLDLLRTLMEALSVEPGIPLLNNSVFFLGNAYMATVDAIVRESTPEFARFVDDYRIFDSSSERLEKILRNITVELGKAGYQVNPSKLRLGSGQEYLDSVSRLKYKPDTDAMGYVRPTVLRDLMRREDIVKTISMSVSEPDKYLNEGFGRFQLAVIRKFRFNESVAQIVKQIVGEEDLDIEEKEGQGPSTLGRLFAENRELINRMIERLQKYSQDPSEVWRTVWLLYVLKIVDIEHLTKVDADTALRLDNITSTVESSAAGILARLWASAKAGTVVTGENVENLHDLGYMESGMLYCKG